MGLDQYAYVASKAGGDYDDSSRQEIAYWLENAKQFKADLDQRMITEQRKNELKVRFSQFHYDFLQEASDEFAAFATRWLDNMPELSRELVIDNG